MSSDEILGIKKSETDDADSKPTRRALRRLEQIERLPRRKQETLIQTIDVFLKSAES